MPRPLFSGPSRYSGVVQVLHWATAILVLVAFIYGPGGSEERVYALSRVPQLRLHETLGVTVLALSVVRALVRTTGTRPAAPPVARWMGIVATFIQWMLLALLFAVPLTAIAGAWLEGHPLILAGDIKVPPMLAASHATGSAIAEIHTWLGDLILWLAGFHAVAALYHHFLLKDKVLVSMLPRWLMPDRGRFE